MYFVGIDLAWSGKNGSGISLLEGDEKSARLIKTEIRKTDQEIIDFITQSVGKENAIISIDAPLIVPNKGGRRLAEEEVGKLFRKYNAGAHPANRTRLSSFDGRIRGEDITKLLIKEGFIHKPIFKKYEKTRALFEVYPHPSIVVLFNLDKILRYKAKPKRDYPFRYNEFEKYIAHLKNLEKCDSKLFIGNNLDKFKLREIKGKKLKEFEDHLDSILCAYIAYYAWKNPGKCAVLGNMQKGYITTPVFDWMQKS